MTTVDLSNATKEQNIGVWEELRHRLVSVWPTENWARLGVLIGCSGGADSTALLLAMADVYKDFHSTGGSTKGFLVVAHFNHGLRGNESRQDAQFVEERAVDLGLKFVVRQGDGKSKDEASMRDQRRRFLREAAHQNGCRYVALAHSLDDNVETALHNLFRGTGSRGIAAMDVFGKIEGDQELNLTAGNGNAESDLVLARPLLHCSRNFIRTALTERGLTWREDSSNEDEGYRRNWIRKSLMPMIESQYPSGANAIARASSSLHETHQCIDSCAEAWLDRFVRETSPLTLVRLHGECSEIAILLSQPAIIIEALKKLWRERGWPLGEMGRRQWRRLLDVILEQGGNEESRFQLPGNIDCQIRESKIILEKGTPVI